MPYHTNTYTQTHFKYTELQIKFLLTQNNADNDEDSDDGLVGSRESLLVRPLPPTHLRKFRPIFTGYLSVTELVIWVR